jgi:hypothetical protein
MRLMSKEEGSWPGLMNRAAQLLGPGEWAFQRTAVCVRHAGFVVSGAADGGSAGDWRGGVPDRDVPRRAARAAGLHDRTAGGDSQRDLRLWAVFVLVPLMREQVNPLADQPAMLGWTGFFGDDNPTGWGFVAAGVILAIMILPIISSLTREVMTGGAALAARGGAGAGRHALGDDPHGRAAQCAHRHCGRGDPGLGRALGETMAVTMVIGNSPRFTARCWRTASTMASVIANEFSEASATCI